MAEIETIIQVESIQNYAPSSNITHAHAIRRQIMESLEELLEGLKVLNLKINSQNSFY